MSTAARTCRLVTLGCKVNQYETQHVKEALELAGWREVVPTADGGGHYVINYGQNQVLSLVAGPLFGAPTAAWSGGLWFFLHSITVLPVPATGGGRAVILLVIRSGAPPGGAVILVLMSRSSARVIHFCEPPPTRA